MGGGIGMGNTCKPMADSFQCMTKPTTKKKKKKRKKERKKIYRKKFLIARQNLSITTIITTIN